MFGLEAAFDPSIYIISVSQLKPEVIISEEHYVMFTKMVNSKEVEEIIKEEALCQVPIYFYDPLAPVDDFWSLREGEEHENEEEKTEEEEATGNDPLDDVSLKSAL